MEKKQEHKYALLHASSFPRCLLTVRTGQRWSQHGECVLCGSTWVTGTQLQDLSPLFPRDCIGRKLESGDPTGNGT